MYQAQCDGWIDSSAYSLGCLCCFNACFHVSQREKGWQNSVATYATANNSSSLTVTIRWHAMSLHVTQFATVRSAITVCWDRHLEVPSLTHQSATAAVRHPGGLFLTLAARWWYCLQVILLGLMGLLDSQLWTGRLLSYCEVALLGFCCLGWWWGHPSASYIVFPSCVFPVSPQEISLPPRLRALSNCRSQVTCSACRWPAGGVACALICLQVGLLVH
jgi:hypothetical protein